MSILIALKGRLLRNSLRMRILYEHKFITANDKTRAIL